MASSLRQTLHCRSHVRFLPPFFYGWLRIVRFQRPLIVLATYNIEGGVENVQYATNHKRTFFYGWLRIVRFQRPLNIASTFVLNNRLRQDPLLDLSFWSFLTFLHHGIEKVKRHLLGKFHKKFKGKVGQMCHRSCSLA